MARLQNLSPHDNGDGGAMVDAISKHICSLASPQLESTALAQKIVEAFAAYDKTDKFEEFIAKINGGRITSKSKLRS